MNEPKLISNWEELSKVPDSETYTLDIRPDDGNGWLINKETGYRNYLSTHTFYGSTYQHSTKTLQKAGFNIKLDNWDKVVPTPSRQMVGRALRHPTKAVILDYAYNGIKEEIRRILKIWEEGCSCTAKRNSSDCSECTDALIDMIIKKVKNAQ